MDKAVSIPFEAYHKDRWVTPLDSFVSQASLRLKVGWIDQIFTILKSQLFVGLSRVVMRSALEMSVYDQTRRALLISVQLKMEESWCSPKEGSILLVENYVAKLQGSL